jgi:hypothetical protein
LQLQIIVGKFVKSKVASAGTMLTVEMVAVLTAATGATGVIALVAYHEEEDVNC